MDNNHEPIADPSDRIPSSLSTDDISSHLNANDESSNPQEKHPEPVQDIASKTTTLRKRNVKKTNSLTSLDGNGTDEEKEIEKEETVVTDEDGT